MVENSKPRPGQAPIVALWWPPHAAFLFSVCPFFGLFRWPKERADKTIAVIPYRSTLSKANKLEDAMKQCVQEHTANHWSHGCCAGSTGAAGAQRLGPQTTLTHHLPGSGSCLCSVKCVHGSLSAFSQRVTPLFAPLSPLTALTPYSGNSRT